MSWKIFTGYYVYTYLDEKFKTVESCKKGSMEAYMKKQKIKVSYELA